MDLKTKQDNLIFEIIARTSIYNMMKMQKVDS